MRERVPHHIFDLGHWFHIRIGYKFDYLEMNCQKA